MNRVDSVTPPADDLDVLLGNFFKGEMPASWPAFLPPAAPRTLQLPNRPARRRGRTGRVTVSRLSLAASVALLLFAAWMLGGSLSMTSGTPLPSLGNGGTAERPNYRPPGEPTPPASMPELPALPDLDLGPVHSPAKKLESSLLLEHGKAKPGHTSVGVTVGPVEK